MPLSNVQPDHYDAILSTKIASVLEKFRALNAPRPEVFSSPAQGFRLRAEFRLWHEGDDLNYVMFRSDDRKTPVVINDFPIACNAIQTLMPALLDGLKASHVLRHKIFQTEFLCTLSGDMLVTLIYHRTLGDDWHNEAALLATELDVQLIGRSRKQKRVISRDWVDECLTIDGREYHYRQPEQAFTQPNGHVNQHMISWALKYARPLGGDLLELYCGIGNFTLPLAQAFNNVIATELSKVATAAAELNRQTNKISNVEFARLSAEDMSRALAGDRAFRRLAHLKHALADYSLNTLLVDPPRAGLDEKTLSLAAQFDNIIYISCNPSTLITNLDTLKHTHSIENLAFFDQFPYTHHLECGVILRRRSESTTD